MGPKDLTRILHIQKCSNVPEGKYLSFTFLNDRANARQLMENFMANKDISLTSAMFPSNEMSSTLCEWNRKLNISCTLKWKPSPRKHLLCCGWRIRKEIKQVLCCRQMRWAMLRVNRNRKSQWWPSQSTGESITNCLLLEHQPFIYRARSIQRKE